MIAQAQGNAELLVPIVVAALTGGFGVAIVAALAARRRTRAEAGEGEARGAQIIVNTAEVLVGLSRREVERLDAEREEQAKRFELRIAEVEQDLGRKIAALEVERDSLRHELAGERAAKQVLDETNRALTERVRTLEHELAELRGEVQNGNGNGGTH